MRKKNEGELEKYHESLEFNYHVTENQKTARAFKSERKFHMKNLTEEM